ncbi:MAG: vWA domain-containing protein [Planctomycetia bacterium]|nr:vWA domain-containing protein [Planctomycetia bacterium]
MMRRGAYATASRTQGKRNFTVESDMFFLTAQSSPETVLFEWGRIHTNADWFLPGLVFAGCVWLVWRLYRRDTMEVGRFWKFFLPLLRTATLFLILLIWLQPQWRTERQVRQNSRVTVMVDTSLSMELPDTDDASKQRSEAVAELLGTTPLVENLRAKHDVTFLAVDSETRRLGEAVRLLGKDEKEKGEIPTFQANGTQSRLADGVREWIQANATTPLSGVILLSDGANNAGGEVASVVEAAKNAGIPVFTVGFGSTQAVENLRIYELEAPTRVQAGDPFPLSVLVQGHGLVPGRPTTVKVTLSLKNGDGLAPLETGEAVLATDGKVEPIRFEIPPQKPGKYTYVLRIPTGEKERLTDDNVREVEVEVVDKKLRVLVLAGGPTREYQFLLTTLFRDKTMETDVLLQSARPGISQEATRILTAFPESREELFAYDTIIAVDPDWKKLTESQVTMLDTWLARQGGGLLLIAGPVYMGETVGSWLEDPRFAPVRAMYPVEFPRRFSTSRQSTYAAESVWPLTFTREGMEADFLRLADSGAESLAAWERFPGVYGYFPTRKAKSGATVLACFSNPQTKDGEEFPILLASQFYGSGRVLYVGTGEFWRLRAAKPEYFTRLYTQFVRYVSQGRMTQQSNRGRLLLTRDTYFPGDAIEVRAMLLDAQMQPLVTPEVPAQVLLSDGKIQTVPLHADPQQPGTYVGSFFARTRGTVRLTLPIPDSEEKLERRLEVVLSDLERENPQRDTAFLNTLAAGSGGRAFASWNAPELQKLPELLRDRTRTVTLSQMADPMYQRDFLRNLMLAIVGLLSLEWLLRRILKLA